MVYLSDYLKKTYGQKVLKLSLSSGCTCPNRDGAKGTGGCTFCAGGSGEFAAGNDMATELSYVNQNGAGARGADIRELVDTQFLEAKRRVDAKFPKSIPGNERKYIAYFQSFSNTYGDTKRLKALYEETIRRPEIVVLSVGTRPDCLEDDKLAMLGELNQIKPVWVELGLQTIHEHSAKQINRCYELPVFEDAYRRLKEAGLTVIVHVILGLPGEGRDEMIETVRFLSLLTPAPDGIKLQMIQVLKGTALGEAYVKEPFPLLSMEDYVALVGECVRILPKETVIHRVTGDPPKRLLIAPTWCADKKRVLNALRKSGVFNDD